MTMGLDMYLTGRKLLLEDYDHPENDRKEDGFFIRHVELELGYWRKHPDLHGYIVQAFAEGEDHCQAIDLSATDIGNIISAIKERRLPHTTGFFFGSSEDKEPDRDIAIFERALAWLGEGPTQKIMTEVEGGPLGKLQGIGVTVFEFSPDAVPASHEMRSIVYRASW
jgi:hypothetical protein